MEHFPTIQGEGFFAGSAAYFIRLGGCDVGCHWCDVKESWPIDAHPKKSTVELANLVEQSGLKIAVITGGEPAMHDLNALTDALHSKGIKTHIETSGAHVLSGNWDWVTFSPKKFKAPILDFGGLASELKVIVYNKSDLKFAETHGKEVGHQCMLYLQPEWDNKEKAMKLIVDYVKKNPQWRISIQSHKYLDIP